MKNIKDKVYEKTTQITRGKVTTYKRLAQAAGLNCPRVVGNLLHRNPDPGTIPCHRVVNAKGKLAKNFGLGGCQGQAKKLRNEGVEVINDTVDLSRYLDKNLK